MHARTALLLPFLSASLASATWHGPLVAWHQDPATTLDVAWIERDAQTGREGEWAAGLAGFGYADDDDATRLPGMQGHHDAVVVRTAFTAPAVGTNAVLVLRVDFDDGFIAWLNGREIARSNATGDASGPWKASRW